MRALVLLLMLAMIGAGLPVRSEAQDGRAEARVVAVIASDARPYQEALQGVRDYAAQHLPHVRVTAITLARENSASSDNTNIMNTPADLYLALGTAALEQFWQGGVKRPIVAGMVLNAADLARFENATGVLMELPVETEIEWMARLLPGKSRVGLLYSPGPHAQRYAAAESLLAARGSSLQPRAVAAPQELPAALKALERDVDLLWGIPDPMVYTPQTAKEILLYSFRHRIPMIGLSRMWVKGGALYALDRDYRDIGMQCGELVKKVLEGAAPSQLPPVHPRKIVYAINMKTARHMKIEIEPGVLQGATEVFE
ncbi:MAG: ABC transporter substrate binding protein [Pseudomonadota bacterium]